MNHKAQQIYYEGMKSILASTDNIKEKYLLIYETTQQLISQKSQEIETAAVEAKLNPLVQFVLCCQHYEIPKNLRFAWLKISQQFTEPLPDEATELKERYENVRWVSIELYQHFFSSEPFHHEPTIFPSDSFWTYPPVGDAIALAKVVIVEKLSDTRLSYKGYWIEQFGQPVIIRPGQILDIKNQVSSLQFLNREVFLPVYVHLLDVSVVDAELFPTAWVLCPDYLIDITAIAQCYSPFGEYLSSYVLNKVQTFQQSSHLLIGNAVNKILDELIFSDQLSFKELLPQLFSINELAWAQYSDEDTKKIIDTIKKHYTHLQQTITREFPKFQIVKEDCIVEPSFYSPYYGLQGRLDLLYEGDENHKVIIELKSGKSYRPNSYGLNHPHYIQTLLYDLLIRRPGDNQPAKNFILYSSEASNNLRHAPALKKWQYDALGIRNQIVILEWQLAQWTQNKYTLYDLLNSLNENLLGYAAENQKLFYKNYEKSNALKRKYFDRFFTFITREHILSKIGQVGNDRNGQTSLWSQSLEVKDRQYNLLAGLEVLEDLSQEENPLVRFKKTSQTNPLANFRVGDIILSYPASRKQHPHHGQIYRATLVGIEAETITIRLRARQYHPIFKPGEYWHIERDLLDSSFLGMYRSLAEILAIPSEKSDILLGLRPPQDSQSNIVLPPHSNLTDIQNQLLGEMINSGSYYLLWGPPGTGKTSVMLHYYVRRQLENPRTRLLLLGYTNRAVDEICDTLLKIPHLSPKEVLRIGSKYGTDEKFQSLLLREKTVQIKSRAQLLDTLRQSRVVCGTIASILGKPELFDLIDFQQIVIDEASQILEPGIIGLLSKGIPFILIGDHKQLPAVVVQSDQETCINDTTLAKIRLDNLANSYFERMYTINQQKNWSHSLGVLKHQGRMHEELMTFPNEAFYQGLLEIIPFNQEAQTACLPVNPNADLDWSTKLSSQRKIFIPTHQRNSEQAKINEEEAFKCVAILQQLTQLQPELDGSTIGIITPYRAQIAQITFALQSANVVLPKLTIDTVERYQGGAKNIIIISYCINTQAQLYMLTQSLTSEGIDRKLNVALTRARQQIIFMGNKDLLQQIPLYRQLIEHYHSLEIPHAVTTH